MSEPTITCPACGDTHAAPGGDPDFLLRGITRCDVCGARIVYGHIAPRVIIEPRTVETPDGPRQVVVMTEQDWKTRSTAREWVLDGDYAKSVGDAFTSIAPVVSSWR